ncbi:MAG: hypothetical protein AB7O97_22700 [Planctomycetota bacterium]
MQIRSVSGLLGPTLALCAAAALGLPSCTAEPAQPATPGVTAGAESQAMLILDKTP